ncbi:hypothetical protein IFR05_002706 [Cadophora sp. M221]|nr:hypothetical protein IFR05_002706 [Cadophora sp. M221]
MKPLRVFAILICDESPPVELQTAPGFAIDLAMAYGTASVKFFNGTLINIANIDGTSQYRTAMRMLAEDSLAVTNKSQKTLPPIEYIPPGRMLRLFPIGIPFLYPLDLKTAINNTVPLSYPYFKLTIPDIITFSYKHRGRFQTAAEKPGLEYVMYAHDESRTAMEYQGIDNCMNKVPHKPCGRSINTMATVSLTGAYGLIGVREPGVYWREIEDKVAKLIHDETVDRVLVFGDQGDNTDFQNGMSVGLLRSNPERNPEKAMQGNVTGGLDAGMWHASRGAAVLAKGMLLRGLDGCEPANDCEMAGSHDEL